MGKIPRWTIWVVALVAAAAALKLTLFREKPIEVSVARIETGLVEETVTNTRAGTVKARLRAKLSPQIGGRVVRLPYAKGAHVPSGALLLKLDDSVQSAQVRLAEQEVKTAEAKSREACLAADLASREWERGNALSKDAIISGQDLDTLGSRREQAQALCIAAQRALDQAKAGLGLAKADLALTEIRAPFHGILADRGTEVGEWITPSPPGVPIPAVLDLLDPGSIYISAPIDELDATRVKVGQEARVTVDSRPGETFAGRIARVAPYVLDIQEQNRTLEVEVDFAEPQKASGILPGTSADAEIIISGHPGVLRIPTPAIAEGKKVLLLEGGKLAERKLETGLSNWRFTEVMGGLKAGDLVVTARDSTAVKPGARARASEQK